MTRAQAIVIGVIGWLLFAVSAWRGGLQPSQWIAVVRSSPVLLAACVSAWQAVQGDLRTFKTWKSFDDAARYSWSLALWHLVQGFLTGAGAAAGLVGF